MHRFPIEIKCDDRQTRIVIIIIIEYAILAYVFLHVLCTVAGHRVRVLYTKMNESSKTNMKIASSKLKK